MDEKTIKKIIEAGMPQLNTHPGYPAYESQCDSCAHYDALTNTCEAFPDKIPDEIIKNEFDHRKPHPGDNGIQFLQEDESTPYNLPPKALI